MKHPNYDFPGIPEGYEVFFRMTRKCRLNPVDEDEDDEDSMKDWKYDRLHNYIKQRDANGNVYVYRIREDNTCTSERWSMKDGVRHCEPGAVFDIGSETVFQETDRESWEYDERGNCARRCPSASISSTGRAWRRCAARSASRRASSRRS